MREQLGKLVIEFRIKADDYRDRRGLHLGLIGHTYARSQLFTGFNRMTEDEPCREAVGGSRPHFHQIIKLAQISFGDRRRVPAIMRAGIGEELRQCSTIQRGCGHDQTARTSRTSGT